MTVLGLDTSNYTTSIAFLSDDGGENCSRLLPVKPGELGLRQSDAVFHHTKSLPELSGRLFPVWTDGRLPPWASGPGREPWRAAIFPSSWWDIPMRSCLPNA